MFKYFTADYRYQWINSLMIAVSAALISNESLLIAHLPATDYFFCGFIFFTTWVAYSQSFIRKNITAKMHLVIFFSGASALVCSAVFIFKNNFWCYLITAVVSLMTLIYFQHGIRKIYYAKTLLLAIVWSLTTVILPVIYEDVNTDTLTTFLIFTRRFFFIAALSIPFEIRDRIKDASFGYRSFVNRLGVNNSKILSTVFLFIFSVLAYLQYRSGVITAGMESAMLLSVLITAVLIFIYDDKSRNSKLILFLTDGMLPLQFLLVLLAKNFH